jgi:hypothetical protein
MNKDFKIFLSNIRESGLQESLNLPVTLNRAGFIFDEANPAEDEIGNTLCSVQIIGKTYTEVNASMSLSEHHFNVVKKKVDSDEKYKSFIWLPGEIDYSDSDSKQLEFINRFQHHLSNNMILSRAPSAVQFVEDIRLILEQRPKKVFDTHPTDVFLICNQVDETEAVRVQKMLSDIIKMVKLTIVQDSDMDYEEYASQQMNVSKLSVIYFKKGAEWAIPFAQQIWKKVGGASAITTILLIGDLDNPENEGKTFNAPRVNSTNVPHDLIPLEIKVQFDGLSEKT